MTHKIYQIDAFTDILFSGNPAAVCPLEQWLSDDVLQKIAMENNLAETAFYVKQDNRYQIRWFTPTVEVDLCGHATLAAAYVLFNHEKHKGDLIIFNSLRSGELSVSKKGDVLTLNFPVDQPEQIKCTDQLWAGFNKKPIKAFKGRENYLFVYDSEQDIASIKPEFDKIALLNALGVIITAKGDQLDFVSRFFAPQSGINEDPVTGSAHTTLTAYWAKRLGKNKLTAKQLSARTGYLECQYLNDRVEISGKGRLYLIGEIFLD